MARLRATDRRLFLLIEIAARRLNRTADARLKSDAGVSAAQASVLFLLLRRGERRLGSISKTLSLNPPAVTGLIDRMAKAGLVTRTTDPADNRGFIIALTPAGLASAEAADSVLKNLNAELEAQLGEEVSDTLHTALTGIVTASD